MVRIALTGVLGVVCGVAMAQNECPVIESRLVASDREPGDEFGFSVATDGARAVVGAWRGDDFGDASGAAYVYQRGADGAWSEEAKLLPDQGAAHDRFGFSVVVEGDRILVGALWSDAFGFNSGAVYGYELNDGAWTLTQVIEPPVVGDSLFFGSALALSGERLVAGSYGVDALAGAAYVYELDGDGLWTLAAELASSGPQAGEEFGWSVALDGDVVVVGARSDQTRGLRAGAAHVFERDGSGIWAEVLYFVAPDGKADDRLGWSVGVSGDLAALGAWGVDETDDEGGAVYVLVREGSWRLDRRVLPPPGSVWNRVGLGVCVDGDRILIGDYGDDTVAEDAGAVYVVERRINGELVRAGMLITSSLSEFDRAGFAVAATAGRAVVGAYNDNSDGMPAGSASVYAVDSMCAADFDGNCLVDTRDVLAFLAAWTAGKGSTDMNLDGVVDTRDVLAYLGVFGEGC